MITKEKFGTAPSGETVYIYTLVNTSNTKVRITNFGAIVQSLFVADRNKKFDDVVLGFDNLEPYTKTNPYFGAIVGRYGNRLNKAKFTLDGTTYQLNANEGQNQLHGGIEGFNHKVWLAEEIEGPAGPSLKLTYHSADKEEGYPGNLDISVTYTLTNDNELKIEYKATTDKPTVLNPTHHTYFNLTGSSKNTILNEMLFIDADKFTPTNSESIPSGELADVANTPMDFRTPTKIGERIDNDFQQLVFAKGYDHNWVLNNYNGSVRKVVTVYDSTSGRYMEAFTDQPGVQFYAGNFLDGTLTGKSGIPLNHRTGLCLEMQHFPDSPNHPNFPSAVLRPGEVYTQTTIYRFSTK
ncbi:MAG: galactose mutarotase [Ignavibacteriaceae bacterium]|nr:galactose mutarotase [Ignavibacteriaceae bacterium]